MILCSWMGDMGGELISFNSLYAIIEWLSWLLFFVPSKSIYMLYYAVNNLSCDVATQTFLPNAFRRVSSFHTERPLISHYAGAIGHECKLPKLSFAARSPLIKANLYKSFALQRPARLWVSCRDNCELCDQLVFNRSRPEIYEFSLKLIYFRLGSFEVHDWSLTTQRSCHDSLSFVNQPSQLFSSRSTVATAFKFH